MNFLIPVNFSLKRKKHVAINREQNMRNDILLKGTFFTILRDLQINRIRR